MPYSLVSIVIPVYNQADHIADVVSAYVANLRNRLSISFEIVVVCNNCRDRSVEICRNLCVAYPEVKLITLERGGWGLAVNAGLKASYGDLLCYTNSARTTPEMLTEMIDCAISNPDKVIKANRKIRENWRRRLGSLLYNLECRALFDLPTWDINGTPKVFPRKFERLLNLRSNDDLVDAEFVATCRMAPYSVLEVPVSAVGRHGGSSTTNYKSALRLYLGAYKLWRAELAKPRTVPGHRNRDSRELNEAAPR